MKFVDASRRRKPFLTEKSHARLRHDHAFWHPDHVAKALKSFEKGSHENAIPYSDRSKFDSATIIEEAIARSTNYPAEESKNGNHVIVFDMGYEVGFDERARRRTSAVTVVVKQTGEVITVHPGTPWSKDQSEA